MQADLQHILPAIAYGLLERSNTLKSISQSIKADLCYEAGCSFQCDKRESVTERPLLTDTAKKSLLATYVSLVVTSKELACTNLQVPLVSKEFWPA